MAILGPGSVDPRFYKVFKGEGEPPELAAGATGTALVALGWAYVALRVLHSAIHVTTNKVRWRFRVFAASWLVLIAYWAVLGATIALSAPAPSGG